MTKELDYVKNRLDDVLEGQRRLEDKLDGMREEQITQREHIATNKKIVEDLDRVLLRGNGQKPAMQQLAEASVRIKDVENDVHALKKESRACSDPASIKKEKLVNRGKVVTMAGLVISQILTWVMGLYPFG